MGGLPTNPSPVEISHSLREIAKDHLLKRIDAEKAKVKIQRVLGAPPSDRSLLNVYRDHLHRVFPDSQLDLSTEPYHFALVNQCLRNPGVVQMGDVLLRHMPERTLTPTRTSYILGRVAAPLLGYREGRERGVVFEFGLGTGLVTAALRRARPKDDLLLIGGDISDSACDASEESFRWNGFSPEGYSVRHGDGFSVLEDNEKPDLIVSNPPYFKATKAKARPLRRMGPVEALDGGNDGTYFYSRILREGGRVIRDGGHIVVQVPFHLLEHVQEIAYREFPASPMRLSGPLEAHRPDSDQALILQAA